MENPDFALGESAGTEAPKTTGSAWIALLDKLILALMLAIVVTLAVPLYRLFFAG